MAAVDVIADLGQAEAIAGAWDELAAASGLPLCAPGWMLPWWRNLAPAHAQLRVMAVREGDELVALAPWYLQRSASRNDVRFLGAEYSDRVDVLARPGHEATAADALREAILALDPGADLVSFEAVPVASTWQRRLAGGAAGRARLARYRNAAHPAPAVTLPAGEPGAWLAARSSNFRSQMGRMRRRLERQGGRVRRVADAAEAPAAIDALLRLHRERWDGRGESKLLGPAVPGLLRDAAASLGPDRLRLWLAEIDGEPISVQLFLAAGEEVKYWNGGWSEQHADLKPSMLTILAALEEGIERGQRRLDLGVGSHAYKLRFADTEDTLTWGGLIVRNRRWPRTRAELAPRVARYGAKRLVERMPAPVRERVEGTVRARREG